MSNIQRIPNDAHMAFAARRIRERRLGETTFTLFASGEVAHQQPIPAPPRNASPGAENGQ